MVKFFAAVWGASLSFSKRTMTAVYDPPYDLPYDERMSGWGFHEIEIALRMQKAGANIVYDPSAGVFHQNHTVATELRRGLNRDHLKRDGEKLNTRYVIEKHDLDEIPRW